MKRLKNLFKLNPIIVKEIRSRMRGPRAFITLTATLLVTGGIMFAILQIILATTRYSTVLSAQVGQGLFAALAFLELFVISAVTPAVTSGAISSEKEHQTYEMLIATPLSPASVLWGKLISALSYIFLLLFAAVPLASVVFIFGGVAPREMLKVLLVLLVVAVTFGILSIFMSALFGRTGRATIASFLSVMLLLLGPLFLAVLVAALRQGEPPRWLLAPSPISALSAALADVGNPGGGNEIFFVLGGIFNMGIAPMSQTQIPRPLYHYSLPFYAILSLVFYLLATRLVQPTRRWRIPRKSLLIGLVLLLGLVGLVAAGFLLTASRYEWVRSGQSQPIAPSTAIMAPAPAVPMVEQPALVEPGLSGQEDNSGSSAPNATISAEEQAEIFAVVARQLYTIDHTLGDNSPNWPLLYLLSVTDDQAGDPDVAESNPVSLDADVQSGVESRLKDLSLKIVWVESRDLVPVDKESGTVENGKGAVITFGNLHPQPDGSVQAPASLYFAILGATGKTYVLNKIDGVWEIIGTTGVEWVH